MNLTEIIRNLYVEKTRVEQSIAALEALEDDPGDTLRVGRRPGRKSMGAEEREKVSERMKKYWAARREQKTARAAQGSN